MRYLFIILTLLLHLLFLPDASLAQVSPKTQSQGSEQTTQLSLDQIKERIRIHVASTNEKNKAAIDKAIATEIGRRGISFQLDSKTLDELQALGAGPMTIESLKNKLRSVAETNDPCHPFSKIIVLVANFKNLDDKESDKAVTETILSQLSDATRNYSDTEIQALNETISPQQGREIAISKGRDKKATIVLWGWYKQIGGNMMLTAHFEPVQDIPLDLKAYQESRVFTIREIESFTIQVQLSKEMTYLTLLTMGMARLLADDYDGTIERLSHALERGNAPSQMVKSSLLYVVRGSAYLQKGYLSPDSRRSFELAIADFTKSTQLDNQEPAGYMLLALACLKAQELDKAFEAANKTISLNPAGFQQAMAHYVLAAVSSFRGEDNRAQQYAAREIEFLESLPPSEVKFALLSDIYLITDDLIHAASSLDEAAKLSTCGVSKVVYALQRAAIYAEGGDLNKAIEEFDSSIRMRPDFARAYWARGKAYFEKKDHKRATTDYDTAIKLDPKVPEYYDDRGDARLALGQWEGAISDYKKATVVDPKFALGFYDLARAYSQKNLTQEAIDSFTQYIALEPDDYDGYEGRSSLYAQMGKSDLAIADANQMLRLKPSEAAAYQYRAAFYMTKGDFDRAIEDCTVYIKARPGETSGYALRAMAYMQRAKIAEAITDYNMIIALKPDNAFTYKDRGTAYKAAGKEDLAIADFKKVVELTKDPKLKQTAESQLELIRLERERRALETKPPVKPD